MSDFVRPHRWKPTRLPRPWDSSGKNTGVGCHFLLQCMKVKSEKEVAQSCPTLSNPMDCSLPGSYIHGIFQARVLEWGATAFSDKIQHVETFNIGANSLEDLSNSCLGVSLPKSTRMLNLPVKKGGGWGDILWNDLYQKSLKCFGFYVDNFSNRLTFFWDVR